MKRTILLGVFLLGICFSSFGITLKTGEDTYYYPFSAPMVRVRGGSSSKCFVTKIAKANGYAAGYYELQLTSCDWVGPTSFPVTFTYIVKKGDVITFDDGRSEFSTRKIQVEVDSISENTIELIEKK